MTDRKDWTAAITCEWCDAAVYTDDEANDLEILACERAETIESAYLCDACRASLFEAIDTVIEKGQVEYIPIKTLH